MKILFIFLISISTLFSKTYEVYVNEIDISYKYTEKDFYDVLKYVEEELESQLKKDFLTINKNKTGIPINFIYVEESTAEKKIKEIKNSLDILKIKIKEIKNNLEETQKKLKILRTKINNTTNRISSNKLRLIYNKLVVVNNNLIKKINQTIYKHNTTTETYNRIVKMVNRKGQKTLGTTVSSVRTYRNGKTKVIPKEINIYFINSFEQLTHTIAHEMGHMIGILEHTEDKNDLMYPSINIKKNEDFKLSKMDKKLFLENLNEK